jgi:hypothetical protein
MTRTEIERITALETRVDEIIVPGLTKLSAATDRIEGRLDDLSLNGHGPDLKALAAAAPEVLAVMHHATTLIEQAKEREDQKAAGRALGADGGWTIRWEDLRHQLSWLRVTLLGASGYGVYEFINWLVTHAKWP